jgi:hypothetical protein
MPIAVSVLSALAFAGCGSSEATPTGDGGLSHGGSSSGGKPVSHDAGLHSGSSSGGGSGSSGSSSGASGSSSGSSFENDGGGDDAGGGEDAGPVPCKRGIGSSTTPPSALAPTPGTPGVTWWYDWGNEPPASGGTAGIEFVPMIWGSGENGPIPGGSNFLLGFNEPNFANQSDMTAAVAAENWPSVEALADAQGIPIVSPAVNFCGSPSDTSNCADPNVTDPYTYLRDFFAACQGCKIDHIAVHWYNCDLPSLQGYIDGNATLEGFVQFGKPIWLTEFCCDNSNSPADQQAYMQAAIPYLEGNPHVYRYSWFSAAAIPNALLVASDGTLTDLGQTYVNLPQTCQPGD